MRRLLAALLLLCACSHANSSGPAAKPSTDETRRATCCAQCGAAASRDPAGMDISGKTCTSYPAEWNSGVGVDDTCRAWFAAQAQPLTVGDCSAKP